MKTMGRWNSGLSLMGALMLSTNLQAADAPDDGISPRKTVEVGNSSSYSLREPGARKAWLLPYQSSPCLTGDVTQLKWFGDTWLAAEIQDDADFSICLFNILPSSKDKGWNASVMDGGAAKSAFAGVSTRSSGGALLQDPVFGPVPGAEQPAPLLGPTLAYVRGGGRRQSQVSMVRLGRTSIDVLTNNGSLDAKGDGFSYYAPTFAPPGQGELERHVVVVSDRLTAKKCIGSGLIALKVTDAGIDYKSAVEIADVCDNKGPDARRAHLKPSFDPDPGRDRLAFVFDDGQSYRICYENNVSMRWKAQKGKLPPSIWCSGAADAKGDRSGNRTWPVFTPDGRFLLYYVANGRPPERSVRNEALGEAVKEYSIEAIDLSNPTEKPRTLLTGVRPNMWQPPPLARGGTGKIYVLAVVEAGAERQEQLVRVAVEDGKFTPIETGLKGIKVVNFAQKGKSGQGILSLAAPLYQDHPRGLDTLHDKAFILPMDISQW